MAQVRLEDALFLLSAGKSSSAYYLAGYAVELALKVCIASLFHSDTIPDKGFVNNVYKHDLAALLNMAGLKADFDLAMTADPDLAAAWGIATKWSEESRYSLWDPITAAALLGAISHPHHGVFQWVKTHW